MAPNFLCVLSLPPPPLLSHPPRSRNLVPKKERALGQKSLVHALRDLTWVQLSMVLSGWFAWTCDAMDFFCVALAVPLLTKPEPQGFGRTTHELVRHRLPLFSLTH